MPRAGLTLAEVVVVLVVLGLGTALVLPSFAFPDKRDVTLLDVVRSARASAVARGETLVLRVEATGAWSLSGHRQPNAALASGQLSGRDVRGVEIGFSPLGGCMLRSSAPQALTAWDVARCAPGAPGSVAP